MTFTSAENCLTELEKKVLESLIGNLYAEPYFSDVDAKDISEYTDIPTKSVRGVLSSLVKKDYIWIDDNGAGFQIIYLKINRWYLHPEWKNSYEYEEWCKKQPLDKLMQTMND